MGWDKIPGSAFASCQDIPRGHLGKVVEVKDDEKRKVQFPNAATLKSTFGQQKNHIEKRLEH